MTQTIPDDGFVIIMGAMKSGTTSLFNYLKAHPAICPSVIKEPEYFSQHQHHGFKAHNLNINQYRDLWHFDPGQHKYALEASTGYTKVPLETDVAKRVHAYGLRPKFIYIVRDPFERILSHRNFVKNFEWADEETFELMIEISKYYRQLEAFTEYFPKDDILVVDFEDLKRAPMVVTKNVFDFLGLPHLASDQAFAVSNATRRESGVESAIRKSVPTLGHLTHYAPLPLRQLGLSLLQRLPRAKPKHLTAEETTLIRETLHSDMLGLRDAFGINVSRWGFESRAPLEKMPGHYSSRRRKLVNTPDLRKSLPHGATSSAKPKDKASSAASQYL